MSANPSVGRAIFRGRIDETTDYSAALAASALDLRGVTAITSRGLLKWIQFARQVATRRLELWAIPDPIVRAAAEVLGVLDGMVVRSVLAPFECSACFEERAIEHPIVAAFTEVRMPCSCGGGELRFAGEPSHYGRLPR